MGFAFPTATRPVNCRCDFSRQMAGKLFYKASKFILAIMGYAMVI
ncbi:MAG: hypothetical protein RL693_1972 [Verrucomicrobiota bacterium]|jgi:hypothetical protein